MFGGILWMLVGPSSSTNTFIPADQGGSLQLPSPGSARLDSDLFQDPMFGELMRQSGVLPIDPTRIGRANPFAPVGVKKAQ